MPSPVGPARILHVVHGYYPESGGGTEAYVRSILDAQRALGHEVLLLHGSFEPRPETCLEPRDELEHPTWRLHRADAYSDYWDKAHYPPAGEVFERFLEDIKPDFVHIHQWIRLTDDLAYRCTSRGIPCAISLHDLYSSCPACFRLRPDDSHCERQASYESCSDCVPLRGDEAPDEVRGGIDVYRANFVRELRSASLVLAATEVTASLVCSGLGLGAREASDLVTLLPLAYDRRFEGLTIQPGRARETGTLRIAYWGNVTARKGVDVLLDGLRVLDGRRALAGQLQLDIFGNIDLASLREDLEARAAGLPVTFRGRYEWKELAECELDLAVFPSTCFETYGFVLDEAFELGVPALITDVGAFGERIGDAGFAVPPAQPDALADALEAILEDPRALSRARAAIPRLSPTPDEHARRLSELYREAAQRVQPHEDEELDRARREVEASRAARARDSAPTQRGC